MATAHQVTEGQLEQFHCAVASGFREVLNLKVLVRQVDETLDRKGALVGTRVFFAAKPAAGETMVDLLRDRSFAFGFSAPGALVPLWVSWGEQWVKASAVIGPRRAEPMLDLVGVSICFYAGNAARQKTQILRAEWDNPLQRGNNAAQPHWHIDPNLIDLPSWKSEQPPQAPQGLEELPSSGTPLIPLEPGFWGLQRLHLGMGGWKHHADNPQCWQHKLELNTIAAWLNRVLLYCSNELPRVTIVH